MLTFLKHVAVLHGGGVGGGSLVYVNQLLVPANLGVNPSLTITALSEFIMAQRPVK